MIVRELIEHLQDEDPESIVVVRRVGDDLGILTPVEYVLTGSGERDGKDVLDGSFFKIKGDVKFVEIL